MTRPHSVVAAALALALGFAVAGTLTCELGRLQKSLGRDVLDEAHAATHVAAARIDHNQRELVALVHALAVDLDSGHLSPHTVDRRLGDEMRARPQTFGLAVVHPSEPGATLIAPAVLRDTAGQRRVRLDHLYDVRSAEWYVDVAAHPEPGWHGPFLSPSTGHFIAYYCEPWSRPGGPVEPGHVCGSWSLYEIEAFRQTLPAGRFGYTWLLSREARSLAHPDVDWLRSARTPDQIADALGDPSLRELTRLAVAGRDGIVHAVDPLTGRDAVMFQEPIATSGWSLVAVVLEHDILAGEPALRRRRIDILVAVLATLAVAAALLLGGRR